MSGTGGRRPTARGLVPTACVLVLTACGGSSSATPIVFDDVTNTASTEVGPLVDDPGAGPDVPPSAGATYAQIRDELGLDAPIVIGEFYLGPDVDGDSRLEIFHEHGFAGSFAWSLMPDRTEDLLTIDLAAAAYFAAGLEVDG